jgi:hypothetical protein
MLAFMRLSPASHRNSLKHPVAVGVTWKVGVVFTVLVSGCGGPSAARPLAAVPASTADDSALCAGLVDRFIGLPAVSTGAWSTTRGPTPLAGRWWVRSCSAERHGAELDVRLKGPGWYWVDESQGDLAVHEQVAFDLDVEAPCRVHVGYSGGIVSVWFEPTREASVHVKVLHDPEVQSKSAWGSVLLALPFVSLRERAAERFSVTGATALRQHLLAGATVTYDVRTGQPDAALDRLGAGKTPPHPFEDGSTWIINDRLLLGPSGTHVLGPIDEAAASLDVSVESGPGVAYRAVCAEDMRANLDAIVSGRVEEIPSRTVVASGTITGTGAHTAALRVERCKFYLVVSALRNTTTVAALRVRDVPPGRYVTSGFRAASSGLLKYR